MANISLLEMGNTKKRNVREAIISLLSRKFPLTAKKIYFEIKKEYHLEVTYQAVFKMIKEMLEDGLLEKSEMEYQLNMVWIKQLENELGVIKHNYLGGIEESTDHFQGRVKEFIAKVGPKVKEYAKEHELCIVGISGPGIYFATSLWRYLTREGIKANFVELNKLQLMRGETIEINKKDFENKRVIIVDSDIFGGTMYRASLKRISSLKEKFKIKEIKFAVGHDKQGLADFSVSK